MNTFQDVSSLISPLALSPQQAATNLAVALVCGLMVARFYRRHHLVNTQAQAEGDGLEISFYVSLRNEDASSRLVSELRALPQIGPVNLFFDEDYD